MKIRSGFVSNSSSSSFIVPIIKDTTYDYSKLKDLFISSEYTTLGGKVINRYEITLPIKSGNKYFGWEEHRYTSFIDKLNYLFLQTMGLEEDYVLQENLKNELNKALLNICIKAYKLDKGRVYRDYDFNVKVDYNSLHFDSPYDSDDIFHIDHQSLWAEDLEKTQAYFKSNLPNRELIEKYLIGESFVQGGNDNAIMSEDYHEFQEILEEYIGDNNE